MKQWKETNIFSLSLTYYFFSPPSFYVSLFAIHVRMGVTGNSATGLYAEIQA